MPRIEYQRIDLPVRIYLLNGTKVMFRVGLAGSLATQIAEVDLLIGGGRPPEELAALFRNVSESSFLVEGTFLNSQKIFRIVLDIREMELAGIDWETLLSDAVRKLKHPAMAAFHRVTIVRQSLVRPRSTTLPMSLPLRILQVDARPEHPITGWVRELFGTRPQSEVDLAVLAAATESYGPPGPWPTVDVLHLDALPVIFSLDWTLSSAWPELVMTLGWLSRQTDLWQTRLVVINCESTEEAQTARKMAQALCDRGGSAVVVAQFPVGSGTISANLYRRFYENLIHDFALDDIVAEIQSATSSIALFGGGGREDALRVSNVALGLFNLSQKLKEPSGVIELTLTDPDVLTLLPVQSETREILLAAETDWATSQYNLHESDGLLPLSRHLGLIRRARMRHISQSSQAIPRVASQFEFRTSEPRYVNSSLWRDTGGQFQKIPQESPGLKAGEVCQLAIQIGARDIYIRTGRISAIIEEVFKWSPGLRGVWVEIAIAGIDFEVIGSPVQELWLPRDGNSEFTCFTISSQKIGVAQIRFGLYYRQNLIQSFRMAVRIIGPEGAHNASPREIAQALSIESERVRNACYMARLEYSRVTDLSELESKPERALTLTANELDSRDILTIKGPDVCHTEVKASGEIRNIVKDVREKLEQIAFDKIPGIGPQYRFIASSDILEERCKSAIAQLASAGWNLFTTLAPTEPLQRSLYAALDGEDKIIQVAQLLRDKVVPWAFVYDRAYDDQARSVQGQSVAQGVCLASVPASGCSFRTTKCGEHPDCLLNEARKVERKAKGLPSYEERTVACPLHFWGFRHIIEIPPRQVAKDEDNHPPERTTITVDGPLQLAAGLNPTLSFCEAHWADLQKIASWIAPGYRRDEILNLLVTHEPSFIYFYCHARGGQADPGTYPPYLEFQEPKVLLRPQDFQVGPEWSNNPLVFLNACGTLGYSPDALSPFLTALVDRRKASGVLGTEVPVAEALAGKFAQEFISRFVGGTGAGLAVLEARRVLLSLRNPLGLVYTLFAPAELAVKRTAPLTMPDTAVTQVRQIP